MLQFPVLARILSETHLLEVPLGVLAMSSAALGDVVAWILLAVAVSVATANGGISALWTLLLLLAFIVFMAFLIRPLLASYAKRHHIESNVSIPLMVVIMLSIFACAWITQVIGVHSIFGAFILGIVVPRQNNFAHNFAERIEDLVVIIFLPLYFTYSGLRTNIGGLRSGQAWGNVILILAVACFGKIFGAGTVNHVTTPTVTTVTVTFASCVQALPPNCSNSHGVRAWLWVS